MRTHRGVPLIGMLLLGVLGAYTAMARDAVAQSPALHGTVMTGSTPLSNYEVTLALAGRRSGSPEVVLGMAATDATGSFTIPVGRSLRSDDVAFVAATDNASARPVVLFTVFPAGTVPNQVVVNERTTVAAAYAMAQFVGPPHVHLNGTAPGITNATAMAANLADPVTGEIDEVLATSPNGDETSTRRTFNSLANMVAACVASDVACVALSSAATPPGGTAPLHTFQAMAEIARHPGQAVDELFALSLLPPASSTPARDIPPAAWTVALRFNGDGTSVDGPGNFAIDHEGNLWVTENYTFNPDPLVPVCGSKVVSKFTPDGRYAPGSPFRGGGLSGAGFGIDIDRYGDVWVANYGFAAPEPDCPADQQPPHNSVSKFSPDGTALSPATGFTQGGVSWPQGTIADGDGNIWIANCQTSRLTRYAGGDPNAATEFGDLGVKQPFHIVDNGHHVFVSGAESSTVAMLRRDGTPTAASPIASGGLAHPLGLAADGGGHVWVANSGLLTLPCPERPTVQPVPGSLTMLNPDGTPSSGSPYHGGGLILPWGIATDGAGNVWVANFAGKRLSQFCGADPSQCPPGLTTGDPISPDVTGYSFDGLVRNTGVAVDPSGNVWLANNWLEVPVQSNPGGHEIVAFVGLAPPVQRAAPIPKPAPVTPVATVVPIAAAEPLPATGDAAPWRLPLGLALLTAGVAVRASRHRKVGGIPLG